MKKAFAFTVVVSLVFLVHTGCDHVSNAQQSAQNITSSRKVLIEDYTGHKCGNCPAAARELKKLDSIYEGKIVPVAIHAGFYATVSGQYTTNLTCQAGDDYDSFFGNSAAGNPNGLVNRGGYGSANLIKQWTDWGTAAYSYFGGSADFLLDITTNIDSVNKRLSTSVSTKAARTRTGNFNLVVWLTEDKIIAEQVDYSLPPGQQFIPNYEFNHVLRASLNSSWGTTLTSIGMAAGDSIVKTVSNYQLSSNWNWRNCHVVAFVYDAKPGSPTQYEVLQVEQKALK